MHIFFTKEYKYKERIHTKKSIINNNNNSTVNITYRYFILFNKKFISRYKYEFPSLYYCNLKTSNNNNKIQQNKCLYGTPVKYLCF